MSAQTKPATSPPAELPAGSGLQAELLACLNIRVMNRLIPEPHPAIARP